MRQDETLGYKKKTAEAQVTHVKMLVSTIGSGLRTPAV